MPKASIVIPAYNAAPYIKDALDSILNQTYTDFECIVIDDGSTDNTLEIVKGFSDLRIKLIQQANSGGPAKPRNVGLDHAMGDYIFLFDADDVMHATKMQESIAALDKFPNADILFTNYSVIDSHGNTTKNNFLESYDSLWSLMKKSVKASEPVFLHSRSVFQGLLKVNFIGTSSVVLRKSALKNHHRFNETLKNSDDRLFWSLFTKDHNAVYLNSILHSYRVQKNSITGQGFARRVESKIRALEILLYHCDHEKLQKIIYQQIASDYLTMAFEFKNKREYKLQTAFALKSLKLKTSLKGIKLWILGTLLQSLSHPHKYEQIQKGQF
jgi:glycosyltransferase involved in cell wall biosynthesis